MLKILKTYLAHTLTLIKSRNRSCVYGNHTANLGFITDRGTGQRSNDSVSPTEGSKSIRTKISFVEGRVETKIMLISVPLWKLISYVPYTRCFIPFEQIAQSIKSNDTLAY